MKFRQIRYIFFLLLVPGWFLTGCKTKINNDKIKIGDDTIFLESFLNPASDVITVGLSVARGAATSGYKISSDELRQAEVTIESEGVIKMLHFSHWNGSVAVYMLNVTEMPVVGGKSYTVRVHKEGVFSAFGSATVPGSNFDFSFEVSGPAANSTSGERTYRVTGHIADEKQVHNYYRLTTDDTVMNYTYNEILVTDNEDALSTISFKTDVSEDMYEQYSGVLYVTNVTKDLYLYLKTISNLEENGGNPFAEPTTLYSNVQGGLGIVGGMNTKGMPIRR